MEQDNKGLLIPLELVQQLASFNFRGSAVAEEVAAAIALVIDAAKNAVIELGIQDTPLEGFVRSLPETGYDEIPFFYMYLEGTYAPEYLNAGLRDIGRLACQQEIEVKKRASKQSERSSSTSYLS